MLDARKNNLSLLNSKRVLFFLLHTCVMPSRAPGLLQKYVFHVEIEIPRPGSVTRNLIFETDRDGYAQVIVPHYLNNLNLNLQGL